LDLTREGSINPFLGVNKEGRIWFFTAFLEFLANEKLIHVNSNIFHSYYAWRRQNKKYAQDLIIINF